MNWLLRLLPAPQPFHIRYAVTATMVILAFAVRMAMRDVAGPYGFILYVPPIMLASLLFDRGSGLFALVLSAALAASIIPWEHNVGAAHIRGIDGLRSGHCAAGLHCRGPAPCA